MIFPASSCHGLHRGQQQLDDPARLLLDHALRDELAEQDQQAVEDADADDRDDDALAVLVGVRVQRGHGHLGDVEAR